MNFLIHEKDGDKPGLITQSNKVFEHDGYDRILHENGLDFVAIEHSHYLNPQKVFVDSAGELANRPVMPIMVDKTTIKAGGSDVAKFQYIPVGAKVECFVAGMSLAPPLPIPPKHPKLSYGEIHLPIAVPCTYKVLITLWPFQDFVCEITAVA